MSRSARAHRLEAYWHIFRTAIREERANPARIAMGVGIALFRIVLIIAIYRIAYGVYGGSSLSYANAMWSIALYFTLVVGLGVRDVYHLINLDVRSGAVETALIKPISWRLRNIIKLLGHNVWEAGISVFVLGATLVLLVGLPDLSYTSPLFILGYLLLFVMALITTAAMFVAVGLVAFWLNDAKPVFRLTHKMTLIFAGAYVPVALLPDVVQTVVRYSPFGVIAASTQLFNPGLVQTLWPTLIASAFWTVMTIWFSNWVWKKASHRIEINGG